MTSDGNHLFVCDIDNSCVKVFEMKELFCVSLVREDPMTENFGILIFLLTTSQNSASPTCITNASRS